MNLCKRFVVLLLFLVSNIAVGLSMNLSVMSPWFPNNKYPGSIEDMRMTVKPQGTYLEVGLYITFNPKGSPYDHVGDSVEATLDFDLPDRAFVNASWLFFSDTTYVNATLIDKWTASFIYEGIVMRQRRDPSILTKLSAGKYRVKVFPVPGGSNRTIKINYFLPADWSGDMITAKLPFDIAKTSSQKLKTARVYTYTDTAFTNPRFIDNANIQFRDTFNLRYGATKLAVVSLEDTAKGSVIGFRHIFDQGIFANTSTNGKENFYQLVIDTKLNSTAVASKKVAFLLDYDSRKTAFSRKDVFKYLKDAIRNNLTPNDSFNIFISNPNVIVRVREDWMPADSTIVASVFNSINTDTLGTTTNLTNLLYSGTSWVNMTSDSAHILLIACTDQHGLRDTANKIGESVLQRIDNHITFSVCSFAELNLVKNNIAGISYAGNDYLYATLVQKSRGLFNKIHDFGFNLYNLFNSTLNNLLGGYELVDLVPEYSNGYTYDQYTVSNSVGASQNNRYTIQYGKFMGDFPSKFYLTGYYRKDPFFKTIYTNSGVIPIKYNNRAILGGAAIRDMEANSTPQKLMIYDIINKSLEYNILSVFTAFLALETDRRDTINRDSDVIPVELMFFDGYPRNGGIDLLWATASETNNYGFYIQKRNTAGSQDWETLAFVEGNGNSKIIRNYNYFDKNVVPNNTYQYWLRQVDKDGTSTSGSKIITVKYDAEFNLTLEQNYPNPLNNETRIKFTLPMDGNVKVEILDVFGNVVSVLMDKEAKANRYELVWKACDSSNQPMPNGTYLCKLTANGSTKVIKMIISR